MHIPSVINLPLRTEPDGTIRVGNTRVTLDVVINEYLSGSTADEIAANLGGLQAAEVHLVIGYYLAHRAEVDSYLVQRRAQADELREKIEALPSYKPLTRDMLQARREAKSSQGGDD